MKTEPKTVYHVFCNCGYHNSGPVNMRGSTPSCMRARKLGREHEQRFHKHGVEGSAWVRAYRLVEPVKEARR